MKAYTKHLAGLVALGLTIGALLGGCCLIPRMDDPQGDKERSLSSLGWIPSDAGAPAAARAKR